MIEKVTLHLDGKSGFVLDGEVKCNDLNPKALLLYAGAKCAGMTAQKIMEKERIRPKRFEISMAGELSTGTVQAESAFLSFNVVYNVECATEDDQAKVSRAVNLAHEKHCGVVRMLRKIAPVSHEVAIVSTQPAKV